MRAALRPTGCGHSAASARSDRPRKLKLPRSSAMQSCTASPIGIVAPGSGAIQVITSRQSWAAAFDRPLILATLSCACARSGEGARRRRSSNSVTMPIGCRCATIWWRIENASRRSSA